MASESAAPDAREIVAPELAKRRIADHDYGIDGMQCICIDCEVARALLSALARLEAAERGWLKYGGHKVGCLVGLVTTSEAAIHNGCTCGWDEIAEGLAHAARDEAK